MGICDSRLSEEDKKAMAESKRLDQQIYNDKITDQHQIKLLLLGTGESGKSTIFKQMQILYNSGFTEYDRTTFRHVVRRNIVESMRTLLQGASRFGYKIAADPKHQEAARFILDVDPLAAEFWTSEIVQHIHVLWPGKAWNGKGDEAVINAYKNRSRLQLPDSAEYLFEAVDRIGEASYIATQDDILRARLRTSGIVERTFKVHDVDFKFLDVGGQRNERRKWIHCFEDVTAVLFIAAISEFDQVLYEDEKVNRLRESINVFGDVCNGKFFEKTAMILFLNKIDIFQEKIKYADITTCFDDYRGDGSFEDTTSFIQEAFLQVNARAKDVFVHLTCATDTQNVERVFEDVRAVVLKQNLRKLGLD